MQLGLFVDQGLIFSLINRWTSKRIHWKFIGKASQRRFKNEIFHREFEISTSKNFWAKTSVWKERNSQKLRLSRFVLQFEKFFSCLLQVDLSSDEVRDVVWCSNFLQAFASWLIDHKHEIRLKKHSVRSQIWIWANVQFTFGKSEFKLIQKISSFHWKRRARFRRWVSDVSATRWSAALSGDFQALLDCHQVAVRRVDWAYRQAHCLA